MTIKQKDSIRGLLTNILALLALSLIIFFMDRSNMINDYIRSILVQCCYTIIMVGALNLAIGFLGQIALGHAGFMAVGAYTSALVTKAIKEGVASGAIAPVPDLALLFIGLLSGAVMAALLGLIVGVPALRLRGDYLAIITLGFGEIIRIIIQSLPFAGGNGLGSGQAGQPLIMVPIMNNIYVIMCITAVCIGLMYAFVRSKYGRAIMAIRDDDIASGSVGVNNTFYKVLTFTISALFAGIAGSLFAHRGLGTLSQNDFTFMKSTEYVIMVVLGGMGSLTGSIIAAISLSILPEALRAFSNYRMLVYSVVLIIVMIFRPIGLCGSYEFSLYRILRKWRSQISPKLGHSATKGGK